MKKLLTSLILFASTSFAQNVYKMEAKGTLIYHYLDGFYYGWTFDTAFFLINEEVGNRSYSEGHVDVLNTWTRGFKLVGNDGVGSSYHARLLSFGALFDSLKVFDVYDELDNWIGSAHGSLFTSNTAEFYLYDALGQTIARATLDSSWTKLIIYDPSDQALFVCHKQGKYYPSWSIVEMDNVSFDKRFLWPFVAFIGEVWRSN